MDPERRARITAMTEAARPVWASTGNTDVLQQFLKDQDCHGVEAVFVTMALLECGLSDAQVAYFSAPCRDADRRFHNQAMDALAEASDNEK